MTSDIFISYSRKDSEHARRLAEQLRANGMKVWMDQESLTPSEQWAGEVVEAIRGCSAFLVLLSSTSVESHNVLKELSLASEKRKRVVPIDLDANDLPAPFQYALAGIQRVGIQDFEGIYTAIKIGPARIKSRDLKKSLMVLPFEDLSPTQDNAWFADGLMSELISSLSNIKSLRLIDEKTSREMRKVSPGVIEIAKSYDVRYFLEGSVRKFGNQVKINVQLLDSQEGEHLWTYTHKGIFAEIFEIQEAVAMKVVEGLKVKLTREEQEKIEDKGTDNVEAYELYIKSGEYSNRHTKENLLHALTMLNEVLRLDPNFTRALYSKSLVLSNLYHKYDRRKTYLIEAEELAKKVLELNPGFWSAYDSLSIVYRLQGDYKKAEEAELEYVRHTPDNYHSQFSLAMFFTQTNQPSKALTYYEKSIQLMPEYLAGYWNLVRDCDRVGERDKAAHWAKEALPYYEKQLKLQPDDERKKVQYASLLFLADKSEEARNYLGSLGEIKDGGSLYDIACLQTDLRDYVGALKSLHRSLAAGFAYVELFQTDRTLDPLRDLPEFQKLIKKLEGESSEL